MAGHLEYPDPESNLICGRQDNKVRISRWDATSLHVMKSKRRACQGGEAQAGASSGLYLFSLKKLTMKESSQEILQYILLGTVWDSPPPWSWGKARNLDFVNVKLDSGSGYSR
jgi:hypothetical protein